MCYEILALCQDSLYILNFSYMLPLKIFMLKFWNNLYCRWKKTSDNQKFIVERHNIQSLRVKYLHALGAYREEGRPIVYADETYIHSSHTTSHAWDDRSGAGLKAPISKG